MVNHSPYGLLNPLLIRAFGCFSLVFRACIAIAICFIISAFVIASRAVYDLAVDKVPGKVGKQKLCVGGGRGVATPKGYGF